MHVIRGSIGIRPRHQRAQPQTRKSAFQESGCPTASDPTRGCPITGWRYKAHAVSGAVRVLGLEVLV
jgi:hypothetical protein